MLVLFLSYNGTYNPNAFLVRFNKPVDLNWVRRIEYEAPGRLDYVLAELAEGNIIGSIQEIGKLADFKDIKTSYYLIW